MMREGHETDLQSFGIGGFEIGDQFLGGILHRHVFHLAAGLLLHRAGIVENQGDFGLLGFRQADLGFDIDCHLRQSGDLHQTGRQVIAGVAAMPLPLILKSALTDTRVDFG